MLLTYNWMYHDMISRDDPIQHHPLIGVPQNIVRCPECGRHTIYMNKVGNEWCLHCDYGHRKEKL